MTNKDRVINYRNKSRNRNKMVKILIKSKN